MVRLKFATDKDRIDGNYILATNTAFRRLRGDIFEVANEDLALLDEHELRYEILPFPDPAETDPQVRGPIPTGL